MIFQSPEDNFDKIVSILLLLNNYTPEFALYLD